MNKKTEFNIQDILPEPYPSQADDKSFERKTKEALRHEFESEVFEPALREQETESSNQAPNPVNEQELRNQIRQELEAEYKQRLEELEAENKRLQTGLAAKQEEEPTAAKRISSKQRKLSLEEYRTTFLQVPHIDNRMPLFVSKELRDRLNRIVSWLAGERRMSASGLVENMVRQHIEIYSEDINQWRRLGDI